MNNTIGLVFATKIESTPFVNGLGLQRIEKKPFEVFNKDIIFLIKSGIGKANAAMATSYLISKYNINFVLNIGAAGSSTADKKLGDIFHVNKVIEFDRPKLLMNGIRIHKPDMLKGFSTASLATQDKPVVSPDERKTVSRHAELVDMEGAAVVQACRLWNVKCYLFKVVTDTPEHYEIEIIKNVYSTAGNMFEFFKTNILNNFEKK
jgi:adenosylhomocysteine nucleosidase